jgi:hypothetical protein
MMSVPDDDIKTGIRAWVNASGFQLRAARELSGWKFEAYALVDRQLVHSEWAESEDDALNKAVVWISKRMNEPVILKWNT